MICAMRSWNATSIPRSSIGSTPPSRWLPSGGFTQIQVVTFPSKFCSDGGRRINIADPEWPSTLEGFAKRAYDFFEKELRPLGYKLHADIISFPNGMPGDVGLYPQVVT